MNTRASVSGPRRARLLHPFLLALAVALAAAGAPAPAAHAQAVDLQPGDALWEVRLADGTTVVGRVREADAERVTIETAAGTLLIVSRGQITRARLAEGRLVNGAYWYDDPNHTRLFLASPTGRTLERGEGYLSAFMVVFPFVAYGVTDDFTIAAGTPIFPEVIGRLVYVAPKLRLYDGPTTDIALGVLNLFWLEDRPFSGGIAYGVGTFGSTDRSLTVGAGWAYAFGEGERWTADRPVLMAGGDVRVARTVKLVTENFLMPGEDGSLLSGGVRLFGERLAVDFGIVAFASTNDFEWGPAGNFVYNFGRR